MSANSFHRRNGPVERGLYWKKTGKDVLPVVKGVSRQVIVVKEPDPRFFEQAIFILKEDAFGQGVTAEQVLQEARRVADGYVRKNTGPGLLSYLSTDVLTAQPLLFPSVQKNCISPKSVVQ